MRLFNLFKKQKQVNSRDIEYKLSHEEFEYLDFLKKNNSEKKYLEIYDEYFYCNYLSKIIEELDSNDKQAIIGADFKLKCIFLDTEDAKKGENSIKAMCLNQPDYVTLVDAFIVISNKELITHFETKPIDVNDMVKKVLKGRIVEYQNWIKSLRKRIRVAKEEFNKWKKTKDNALNY
jgi:hypothetical protein